MIANFMTQASTVGSFFATSGFLVPNYQREYAWGKDQVKQFLEDINEAKEANSGEYFLGLFILTKNMDSEDDRYDVVDGQQRILTLTLFAVALLYAAKEVERVGTASELERNFIKRVNKKTDKFENRLKLTSNRDNHTLENIINSGEIGEDISEVEISEIDISDKIIDSYNTIQKFLENNLPKSKDDKFKEIGIWSQFLLERISVSVFIHPEPSAAYKIFEVINTRGKSLTTADLIKSHLISSSSNKDSVYQRWVELSQEIAENTDVTFVQFIRHVLALEKGRVLPTELFDIIKNDIKSSDSKDEAIDRFISNLEDYLPYYRIISDPRRFGSDREVLYPYLVAFKDLSILAVRPILLAILTSDINDDTRLQYFDKIIRMVVSRIVVGNFGTGTVENHLFDLAKQIAQDSKMDEILDHLNKLTKISDEFKTGLQNRNLNKSLLEFLRKSELLETVAPLNDDMHLHFVVTKRDVDTWVEPDETVAISKEIGSIGNTFISSANRRPKGLKTWNDFFESDINDGQEKIKIPDIEHSWDADFIIKRTELIANALTALWFNEESDG